MSEVETGLADGESAGLDSIISGAIEKFSPEEAKAPLPDGEKPSDETRSDKTGRLHAKDGKFAPKTSAAEAPEGTAKAAKPAEQQPVAPDPAPQPVEAPTRWTPDQKAEFAKWSPETQKVIAERYKAMEADYTRKTQETADLRKSAEPVLSVLKPYEAHLAEIGRTTGRSIPDVLGGLLSTAYQLQTGNEAQRYQLFANLARDYRIDLRAFTTGQIPQEDPVQSQLRQELSDLKQWRAQQEQQANALQSQQLDSTINAFRDAKDEAGRPKYPHFELVKAAMANLLGNAESGITTLEQAYQKAAEPLNAAIAGELQSRTQQADQQRSEAVAKAQKAQSPKTAGNAPGATKAKGLDAILSESMAAHGL